MHPVRHSSLVALTAALALAVLGLLPPAHVHQNEAGPTVHRHTPGTAHDHHEAAAHAEHHFDSDDHATAGTLPDEFVAASVFALTGPQGEALVLDPPVQRVASRPDIASHLPTHDPPLRYFSSPAPPLAS